VGTNRTGSLAAIAGLKYKGDRMDSSLNPFDMKADSWEKDPVKVANARKVADEIIKVVGTTTELNGFEYGCGTGLVSFFLQPYLKHIVLADNSKGMLKVAAEKIEQSQVGNMSVLELDLTSENVTEKRYGIIYSLLTMHHIADVKKLFSTFFSMLEPGGFLFIADLDKEDGSFHGQDFDGHNGFDRLEMRNWCISVGFTDIEFKTITSILRTRENGSKKVFPVFLLKCSKM
jgi:ubiquinone/menaquinone biosynthesis C-methylase UbiE